MFVGNLQGEKTLQVALEGPGALTRRHREGRRTLGPRGREGVTQSPHSTPASPPPSSLRGVMCGSLSTV